MDEVLDVVDVLADSGLEGLLPWLLRLIGLVAVIGVLGLWLFTDVGLLAVPALLIVVGLILSTVPNVPLGPPELAG